MPKRTTIFTDYKYYHLCNKSYGEIKIFENKKDYSFFLDKIKKYQIKFNIIIDTYSIIEDHYHLLVKQLHNGDTQKFISRLQLSFAAYFNRKKHRVGPVFRYRYSARQIKDSRDLNNVKKYIMENPLKMKILKTPIGFSSSVPEISL